MTTSCNTGGQGFAKAYTFVNSAAATDLNAVTNLFVANSSSTAGDHKCDLATTASVAVGITNRLKIENASTWRASVVVDGHAYLRVNGSAAAISPGDSLVPTTGGLGIKTTTAGAVAYARALEYASGASVLIPVIFDLHIVSESPVYYDADAATETITAAQLANGTVFVNATYNGAIAMSIPAAASTNQGARLIITRTVANSAITITPVSGTIAGAASHATLDKIGDTATFISDGAGNWFLSSITTTTGVNYLSGTTTSETLTAADFDAGEVDLTLSNASATALTIPGGVSAGATLRIRRTGGDTAVTITPASGTIDGGSSYAAIDRIGDIVTFKSDGTNWIFWDFQSTANAKYVTGTTTSETLAAADFARGDVDLTLSNASATALSIPGGVTKGSRLRIRRTGGNTAVTITPTSGTVAGGSSYAAIDRIGDDVEFVSDGTNWVLAAFNATLRDKFITVAATTGGAVVAADFVRGGRVFVNTTHADATALAFPDASTVPTGSAVAVLRTGGATAVTITPAAGTIDGGGTYAALDAVKDIAEFISDGTNWLLGLNKIA